MQLGLACPVCSQLNVLRTTSCVRCGAGLTPAQASAKAAQGPGANAPSPAAHPKTGPQMSAPTHAPAPQAGAPRFDTSTGQPVASPAAQAKPAARTMFFGALQQQSVVPRLVVIKGEGGDGVTYHLSGTNHVVGRGNCDIRFAEDHFLNPEHARFTAQDSRLFVKDLDSANGVFVRIKSPVPLTHDDCFLVGEQLLRIDARPLPDGRPDREGTYRYSSPRPDGLFRIVQLLAGGGEAKVCSARGGSLTIGREGNIVDFPTDRFISGRHARLDIASDSPHVILTDTGSRNGTFVRIKGAQELFHGDYLFVGQQLLRVEIS